MADDFIPRIEWLERQWSEPDGLLDGLREGRFDWVKACALVDTLRGWGAEIDPEAPLPARFVALLWHIPMHVDGVRLGLLSSGVPRAQLDEFHNGIVNALYDVLGVP